MTYFPFCSSSTFAHQNRKLGGGTEASPPSPEHQEAQLASGPFSA